MTAGKLDRSRIMFEKLSSRKNKVAFPADAVIPESTAIKIPEGMLRECSKIAGRILEANRMGSSVTMAFGAHAIKNGLGPVLIEMIKNRWINHLATNGAGIIHDWELSFQGKTSEDVAANVSRGKFGIWEETGLYINLALLSGAYRGMGYGESVGCMIAEDGLDIPDREELAEFAKENIEQSPSRAAAAIDFRDVIIKLGISPGFLEIKHPYKKYSVQAAAYQAGVNFTGHPMIGHDIIYTHPANSGAAVGRTAETDFLRYADSISRLEGGVYLSVGSAVMSPMIFEKSLSMARNIALQEKRSISNFSIYVVDLAESAWDWENSGEPPADDPAYYLRYCKTFSRMGGRMRYITADNKIFLPALYQELAGLS